MASSEQLDGREPPEVTDLAREMRLVRVAELCSRGGEPSAPRSAARRGRRRKRMMRSSSSAVADGVVEAAPQRPLGARRPRGSATLLRGGRAAAASEHQLVPAPPRVPVGAAPARAAPSVGQLGEGDPLLEPDGVAAPEALAQALVAQLGGGRIQDARDPGSPQPQPRPRA